MVQYLRLNTIEKQIITEVKVPNKFFGTRDFPYLKLGIRDFKAQSGRDSGSIVCVESGEPKITRGITGLHKVLGRDYGTEESYKGSVISFF